MATSIISLGKITKDEAPIVWKFLQEYLVELLRTIGNPEGLNLEEEIPYPYFESYWEEENRFPFWAVDETGEKIGFVFLRDTGSVFSIAEFYIFPDQRDKGYGRALLDILVVYCRKKKRYKVLFANCFDKNATGYKFWTENGFYPVALEESPEGAFHILQFDLR
ncbi:MAG: GNAT family N-acetyltransferase [Candidatus Hodarchaeota archaeon]